MSTQVVLITGAITGIGRVNSGIRVNAVAPGPVNTGMLTRFTGTPENKAALVSTVPMARLGLSHAHR